MKKNVIFLFCILCQNIFSQPVINSFSPSSGPLGTTVVITGSGFSGNANNNIVFFGAVRAVVSAAASTSLTVTVPAGASYQPITVTTAGLTASARNPFVVTFPGGGAITASSFAPKIDLDMTAGPVSLVNKDVDNDGKPDMIISSILSTGGPTIDNLLIYKNNSTVGNFSFSEATSLSSPIRSLYLAVEDMDGDGKPDILAPINSDQPNTAVNIYKNSTAGGSVSFAAGIKIPSGGGHGIAVADFDGDGMRDFATTLSENSGLVCIHRNSSFGGILSFDPYVSFSAGTEPRAIAAGYINEDNKPDLVFSNLYGNVFSVLINTSTPGNISFAQRIEFPTTVGGFGAGIAIGDFDGDDKADVAVANNNYEAIGTISVFRNTSVGNDVSFTPKKDLTTGYNWYPFGLSISDIDGNGKPEIIVSNQFNTAISVFRNTSSDGSLSFEPKADFTAKDYVAWGLTVGDLDNDGKPDISGGTGGGLAVSLFRNTIENPGLVSFSPTEACADSSVTITGTNFTGATAVSFGGIPAASFSVVSATIIKTVPGPGATGVIAVTTPVGTGTISGFTNTGTCALPPRITSFNPISGPAGTVVTIKGKNFSATSLNNTVYFGAARALVTNATDTSLTVKVPRSATNKPLTVSANNLTAYAARSFNITFNGGDLCDAVSASSFGSKLDFSTGASPYATSIVEMDGDSKPDVAVANFSSNNISLLKSISNTGSIAFQPQVYAAAGMQPVSISYGDLDGDGNIDIAVADYAANNISVLRNTSTGGNANYTPAGSFATGNGPRAVFIQDVDMDGRPDVVTANFSEATVSVLRNTSSGTGSISFAGLVSFASGNGPTGIYVMDINEDHLPDIVVANSQSNSVSVLKNSTSGIGDISFNSKTDLSAGSQPVSIFLDDLNADGRADIIVSNNISSTVSVFKNTSIAGNISFAAKIDFATGLGPASVTVADINGDNKPDIGTSNVFDGSISLLKNTGLGGAIAFADKIDYNTGSSPRSIAVGDINGDSKPDLVAANYDDNTISVLKNIIGFSPGQICAGASVILITEQAGNSYQWQQDAGTGFANIDDNTNFSGTYTSSLQIMNEPSSWYGYKFRCIVDGNAGDTTQLSFVSYFNGTVDTSWENPANWSCNQLPNANVDVVITCSNNVVLNSNVSCRSVTSKNGASVVVKNGFTLTITH